MPGEFSSKKVSRAARAGGRRRRRTAPGSTSYSWYALLVIIILVGTGTVAFSRHQKAEASNPGSTPPLAPSTNRAGDTWYQAIGIYLCDNFAPNINNTANPYGVSTKNDGVLYIAPQEKKYAGHHMNLGLFAKSVGMKLDATSVQLPGDTKKYGPGVKCGDKDGELVVKQWTNAKDDTTGKIIQANPRDILLQNNAAITIAFVPKGDTNIPLPPSAKTLDQAAAAAAAANAAANSSASTDTTATTAPGTTATTAATTPTTAAVTSTTATTTK